MVWCICGVKVNNMLNYEPFLSCPMVETTSTQTFKDLPIGALFANINNIPFVKISDTEAVNLYTQLVINFGPREYKDFNNKSFTFSELDSPVLLVKFYA